MKGRIFIGAAELAQEAAGILSESGPVQERGTVRDLPDERTIRYYLFEGLLAPAEDKQGTASVFGYLHLLQLLVVKRLQAENLPIRKIRELVEGRTERELERLLGSDEKQKNEAINYLESLLTSKASAHTALPRAAAPQPQPERVIGGSSWSRVEIEPGLELHVRDDYEPPRESKGMQRLASAIIQGISSRLGKRRR